MPNSGHIEYIQMKNLYFSLIMGVLMLCTSCNSNEKQEIIRLVKEWRGKEIVLPDSSVFTIQGKDTIDFNMDSMYKILVYVDSAGCTSCRLQLHKWKEFITEVDSITHHSVKFLFYLTPKNVKEARYITRRDDFTYPMCIDPENKINARNHFPIKDMFHTFLLDADNRVQVIGNPIHNSAVRELYLKTICHNP